MYTQFYKLSGKPFQLSPDPRFFFASGGHQKALSYLRYGLHQGEGFMVVTGDVGTGKTTLLSHLFGTFDSRECLAARLVSTQVGPDDTLRLVAAAFGIEVASVEKAILLQQIERFLLQNQQRGRRVLLFVDEVQNLPVRSLEELRMLSNFQSDSITPIQFCLVGQPQFQQILAGADLMQLRQRVVAAYHLGPLEADETRAYVEHRLRLVGWQADPTISNGAFSLIHQYSAGVPRQINTLCDRLLLYGMLEEQHRIDEQIVEDVSGEMLREGTRTHMDMKGTRATAAHGAYDGPPLGSLPREVAQDVDSALESRVASLEARVETHQKTLKRMIGMATNYLLGPGGSAFATKDRG